MHPKYAFLVNYAKKQARFESRILDYGCGSGEVVQACLKENLNIVGFDSFYEGGTSKQDVIKSGMLGKSVFELNEQFEMAVKDSSIDVIICNQVLEHVENINQTVNEFHRVLSNGGIGIFIFPDISVIKEGHCGIPYIHRFNKNSRFRFAFIKFWREIGFGYHKQNKSVDQWCLDFLKWLDDYTYYRPLNEIINSFEIKGFVCRRIEVDYVAYRLRHKGIKIPNALCNFKPFRQLVSVLYRKFGGIVLEVKKSGH